MSKSFELAPRFEPGTIESKWYAYWSEKNLFRAERDIKKKPYTIMIPPPNVTGSLHLGHALNNTLQDVMIRFKRMQGFNTLWLPGTDHAGIATQAVVERKLFEEEGLTREDLGREEFVGRIWKWKEEFGNRILKQLRELGCSCDWSRARFTLDEGLSKAVRVAFVEMFKKGLIYKGARIVNWDCTLQTAVSDDEIEMVPEKGMLAYIKYPVKGEQGSFLEVATTRPETMFGDTGVAVHPKGKHKNLVGKTLVPPFLGRDIPVVADETVDPEFGTGAVKITPGHDPADFERGQRHNLETLIVFNHDGTLNEKCGDFAGMQRKDARKRVINELEELDLLTKVEEHEHNVPQSDRSKTIIEPLVSEQWFVKMSERDPETGELTGLVAPAIEAVESGEVKITPERWTNNYLNWLHNIQDWCISRQLWWGHRIPIYYDEDGNYAASVDPIETHPETGKPIVRQEEDVLDTWFSSALWPFSTLGWPDDTADLGYFYPTNALFTAPDIIYLWVARMVMQGEQFIGKKPFNDVFLHPTILDERGKRMSKSKGNGIDPLDMIEVYGVDSMRFSLASMTTENQDIRLAIEREKPEKGQEYGKGKAVKQFENARNFINKVWNACRFALGNVADIEETLAALSKEEIEKVKALEVNALEDRWILSRLTNTLVNVTDSLERFRFHDASQELYHFIWDEFCDWYLEVIKPRFYSEKGGELSKALAQATLLRCIDSMLKMLHPFSPFVTEEIWQVTRELQSVLRGDLPAIAMVLDAWPKAEKPRLDEKVESIFSRLQEIARGIRNVRADQNIAKKVEIPVILNFASQAEADSFDEWQQAILKDLVNASEFTVATDAERPKYSGTAVMGSVAAYVPLEGLIDLEMEKRRLVARIEKLRGHIHGLRKKLENEGYLERAPKELVQESRDLLKKNVEELARLEETVEELNKLDG